MIAVPELVDVDVVAAVDVVSDFDTTSPAADEAVEEELEELPHAPSENTMAPASASETSFFAFMMNPPSFCAVCAARSGTPAFRKAMVRTSL